MIEGVVETDTKRARTSRHARYWETGETAKTFLCVLLVF